MRILKVIHGFPPDYMAGSEVYSYHLTTELVKQNVEVFLFTRVENEFDEDYKIYNEKINGINIRRVNKPKRDYLYEEKFFDDSIDKLFEEYLLKVKPDIVHIGHLSHLSTNIIKIVKSYNIPIVYTIHDFWLFCIRGQMVNYKGKLCESPSIEKCMICSGCYMINRKIVEKVFKHMKKSIDMIDLFISPSYTLKNFFIEQGVLEDKIKYLKYGFDKSKIKYKRKIFNKNSKITFGFMGRIIPTKGIKVLVEAFKDLKNQKLYIYGNIGSQKRFLERKNIIFKGPYNNDNINEVLQNIDVLIVPSTWYENSPLVIQEAFLAGVPVITSDIGGMAELVKNLINGFTFKVGDSEDLKRVILEIVNNPEILNNLKDCRNDVVDIKDDVKEIIKIYESLLK